MLSNTTSSSQQNQNFTFSAGGGSKKPVSRRGLLINGKWHCDCDPPVPAQHLQTKNGGRNHGRWFYTCRKPQRKRCGFFLWDDDARRRAGVGGANTTTNTTTTNNNGNGNGNHTRNDGMGDDLTDSDLEVMAMDESVVSGAQGVKRNGVVESYPEPKTPTHSRVRDVSGPLGLLTPVSGMKKGNGGDGNKRKREWDEMDESLAAAGGDDTPSKRGKMTTPTAVTGTGTRTISAIKNDLANGGNSNNNNNNNTTIYPRTPPRHQPENKATSSFSTHYIDSQLLSSQHSYSPHSFSFSQSQPQSQSQFRGTPVPTDSPPSTPTPSRFLPASPSHHSASKLTSEPSTPSGLTTQVISLLTSHKTPLQPNARKDLAKLLDTHDLRLRGVSKGRDISRVAVRKKEEQVQNLLSRIDVLEAEREAWRASALRKVEEEEETGRC